MKPHLIIKTKFPFQTPTIYWEEAIHSKEASPQHFFPAIDAILKGKYKMPYWLTYNFKPQNQVWSPSEKESGFHRIYRLILQKDTHIPPSILREIQLLPEVSYVRVGNVAQAKLPDSNVAQAASLSQAYRNNGLFLKEAHLFSKGSRKVKIAILDTGFEVDHPEIRHAMLPGKDFVNIIDGAKQFIGDFLDYDDTPEDEVGHGTHVAGIIAAKGYKMPIGVVPECKIIPVKVLGALKRGKSVVGAGLIDNINNGIKWAVDQGADVINMSLGIKHMGGGLPHDEVIQYALKKGVTVVAASGNDGMEDKYYPGALPGVIAVGPPKVEK
ncbi:MAG: S8 family serine peptidase [Bacteroidota bacterium]